ncbi:hypothetical protein E2320_001770, partial [Naja naja]
YGGLNLDFSYITAVAEELGSIRCGSIPMAVGVQSNELKKEFLAPTIAGDIVACLGVSEPEAGSDVASIHVAKKIDKLGVRASDTAEIFFENVRIPSKYLIGEEGMGFKYQMLQFQEERMWGVASSLSILEILIKETIDYTSQRKTFGQPILHNQIVHFRLAELATELELLRALLYEAVGLYLRGNDVTKFASMAKLKCGRLCREISDSCLQFWGGMGYTNEVLVSRMYRDLRLISIGGGADEIMLYIICKHMGILPQKN